MPLLMIVVSLLIGQAGAPAPLANLLLSPKALADLLPANTAVVLHVGDKASYDAGHVPGAQLFEVREISETGGTLRTQMLPIDGLRAAFEAHGVTDSNRSPESAMSATSTETPNSCSSVEMPATGRYRAPG